MRCDRQNQFFIAGFLIAGFVSTDFTVILLGFHMLFVITGYNGAFVIAGFVIAGSHSIVFILH